jgi:hypothetical protein
MAKTSALVAAAGGVAIVGCFLTPAIQTALNTVCTDDAYVSGHVTFVAPRVAGQVTEELDRFVESERVAEALTNQALEEVFETRVTLGLPPRPEDGDLSAVPVDLNQNFSGARQALADLVHSVAQVRFEGRHFLPSSDVSRSR